MEPFRARAPHPSAESRGADRLLHLAIARLKQGHLDALHYIYVRFADDVCGYVTSIVRDPHEAEDITQNVFAKLTTAIARYEQRDVPFAAWILRVARNMAIDHIRVRRQIPFDEVRTSDEGHDQIGFDRRLSLRDALDRLPADQRAVLLMRHIGGFSPPEIAAALGKTESSVHGLHHRGRIALQAMLRDLDAAPRTALA